jgi:hypothetical protein
MQSSCAFSTMKFSQKSPCKWREEGTNILARHFNNCHLIVAQISGIFRHIQKHIIHVVVRVSVCAAVETDCYKHMHKITITKLRDYHHHTHCPLLLLPQVFFNAFLCALSHVILWTTARVPSSKERKRENILCRIYAIVTY